jgi:hypothetical protein
MTLPSDFAALIALASADELDGIKAKILDRVDELGGKPAFELLKVVADRRKGLAEGRRAVVAPEVWEPDGEEGRDGW